MTCKALRIFRTSNPSSTGSPIHPMTKEDQEFWRIIAERRQAKERGQT